LVSPGLAAHDDWLASAISETSVVAEIMLPRNRVIKEIRMKRAVYCIALSREQAEKIVQDLRLAGFSSNDISALMPDKRSTRDFAHEQNTKAPEGAVAGGAAGMGFGAALGWLASIGSLTIPGVGPFIAAGPLMAALSGAAVGGVAGSIVGALVGLGIPEYEAKRYEGKVRSGNILISVHTDDGVQRDRAKKVFERAGAEDIGSSGEASVKAA